MANSLITNADITFTALRRLKNNTKFVPNLNRDWENQFGNKKHQIGQTLSIRRPNKYTTRLGQSVNIQAVADTFVPLTLNIQRGCDISLASIELAADVETLDRIIGPQIDQLANDIDNDGLFYAKNTVSQQVGTPGTVPATNLVYLQANQKLSESSTPMAQRRVIINPAQATGIVNQSLTSFNPQDAISQNYRTGMIGKNQLGFEEWYQDQNVAVHTVGTYSGTPVINGAGQTGASVVTSGWGTTTLNQGDVLTFAGVFAVNTLNRNTTGSLRQFVVTATVTAVAGALTIPIDPPMQPTGQYQNVTGSPANNATVTVSGASGVQTPQAIAWHPDAFTVAFLDLDIPNGIDIGAMKRDPETGISLRFIRAYNVQNDQWISRFDVVYGYATTYADLATRIAG